MTTILHGNIIHAPVQILEPGLRAEGVGIQPVQQGQIHAHAQHGVLGGVEVQVL